jgi:hypothetical protein
LSFRGPAIYAILQAKGIGEEMRTIRLLSLVLALALAGCLGRQSEAEIAARKAEFARKDDEVCKSYGAKPGTDIYIQCRMAQAKARDDADNATVMSQPQPVIVNNNTSPQPSTPMLQPIAPPTRCQSMNVGMGRVHTYCN